MFLISENKQVVVAVDIVWMNVSIQDIQILLQIDGVYVTDRPLRLLQGKRLYIIC